MTTGTIIFFAVLFFILLALVIFFGVKAVRLSKGPNTNTAKKFTNELHIQTSYDRIRKRSKVPCSILFIKIKTEDTSAVIGSRNYQKALDKISDIFLTVFGRSNNNMIASIQNKEYIVLTNMSEADIIKNINIAKESVSDFTFDNPQLKNIEFNVGAYLMPASVIDYEEAIKRCRLACEQAIQSKTSYFVWDYNLQKAHEEALLLDRNLARGLEKNKFFIELQPVIDIEKGMVFCAEALTRLSRDNAAVLTPKDFLSAIDNMGIYDSFDYMVFGKTCKWLATHRDIIDKIGFISVNFSRASIAASDFTKNIFATINEYNLPYNKIGVEILEDKAESDIDSATFISNIRCLREKGVVILLDDFGTGFTSFDDIRDLQIDVIKIDKSIIQNTGSDRGKCVINSILSIAKEIDAVIICEGVETPEQLEVIKHIDCNLVQGYYFFKPMNTEQFEKLVINTQEQTENAKH